MDIVARYVALKVFAANMGKGHSKQFVVSVAKELDTMWDLIPPHQILEASRRVSVAVMGGAKEYRKTMKRRDENWFSRYPYMRNYARVAA